MPAGAIAFDQQHVQLAHGERVLEERDAGFVQAAVASWESSSGPVVDQAFAARGEGVDRAAAARAAASDPPFERPNQTRFGESLQRAATDASAASHRREVTEHKAADLPGVEQPQPSERFHRLPLPRRKPLSELDQAATTDTTLGGHWQTRRAGAKIRRRRMLVASLIAAGAAPGAGLDDAEPGASGPASGTSPASVRVHVSLLRRPTGACGPGVVVGCWWRSWSCRSMSAGSVP